MNACDRLGMSEIIVPTSSSMVVLKSYIALPRNPYRAQGNLDQVPDGSIETREGPAWPKLSNVRETCGISKASGARANNRIHEHPYYRGCQKRTLDLPNSQKKYVLGPILMPDQQKGDVVCQGTCWHKPGHESMHIGACTCKLLLPCLMRHCSISCTRLVTRF